jgi:hypothetical protein
MSVNAGDHPPPHPLSTSLIRPRPSPRFSKIPKQSPKRAPIQIRQPPVRSKTPGRIACRGGPEECLRRRLPGNAHFLPTEKCTLRREGDPETGLPFIFRYLCSIRREIGLPNAAKYVRSFRREKMECC